MGLRGQLWRPASHGQALADIVGLPDAGIGDMGQGIELAKARTGYGDAIVIFGSFNAVEQSPWLA